LTPHLIIDSYATHKYSTDETSDRRRNAHERRAPDGRARVLNPTSDYQKRRQKSEAPTSDLLQAFRGAISHPEVSVINRL
jgi:hypothetical protein